MKAVGFFIMLAVCWAAGPAIAGSPVSGARDGVAIQGYDTVAYWIDGKALKGKPEFAAEWQGALWMFSSAENRDAFQADPAKYAPEYGGHCATSVANWKLSRGAGDAWSMYDGKLYLNGSKEVRGRWEPRASRMVYQADQAWPTLRQRLVEE